MISQLSFDCPSANEARPKNMVARIKWIKCTRDKNIAQQNQVHNSWDTLKPITMAFCKRYVSTFQQFDFLTSVLFVLTTKKLSKLRFIDPLWRESFPRQSRRRVLGSCNRLYAHGDVIKWKHFPRCWLFVQGNHRSPVNFPHKCQWRGALMFSVIIGRTNGCVNNRDAGDLRRHRAYYDVTVMYWRHFMSSRVVIKTNLCKRWHMLQRPL